MSKTFCVNGDYGTLTVDRSTGVVQDWTPHPGELHNKKDIILFVTVGLPRSGKSTWAKTMNLPVVNRDAIRLAIHGQAFLQEAESIVTAHEDVMARSLAIQGLSMVIDATNLTIHFRNKWRLFAKQYNMQIKFVCFTTTKEECLNRAEKSNALYLYPIIEKMNAYMTFPPASSLTSLELESVD